MPRRRSQSRALVWGAIAVVLGFAALWGVAALIGRGSVEPANLADRELRVGNADRLANRVAEDGEPLILPDLSPDRDRVVFLQHVGDDHTTGWFTVLAGTKACPVEWTGEQFRDCRGDHGPEGEGLTRYKTYVKKNGVFVDLRTEV